MVISDLQYLESVESSTVVGGGKRRKPKHKTGGRGYSSFNFVNQFAKVTNINLVLFSEDVEIDNDTDIDQSA